MKKIAAVMFICLFSAAFCHGQTFQEVPLQISIWDPIQLFSDESDVIGPRFSLPYGCNRSLSGIDVGLVNDVKKSLRGIGIGGFVNSSGEAAGIYLAGICNLTGGGFDGIEIAGVMNVFSDTSVLETSTWRGLQLSGVANAGVIVRGVQICGLGNMADNMKGVEIAGVGNFVDTMSGFQAAGLVNLGWIVEGFQFAGLYNRAHEMNGLQIGLINNAHKLHGVQIGLLNIITEDLTMSVLPLVNASF